MHCAYKMPAPMRSKHLRPGEYCRFDMSVIEEPEAGRQIAVNVEEVVKKVATYRFVVPVHI